MAEPANTFRQGRWSSNAEWAPAHRPALPRWRGLQLLITLLRLLALLSLGLAVGFAATEIYSLARFGVLSGPLLMTVILDAGFRLPRTSWIGIEHILELAFTSSAFICAGIVLAAAYLGLASAAHGLRRLRSALLRRSLRNYPRPVPREVVSSQYVVVPTAVRILQAYEQLDREPQASTPPTGAG